MRGKRKTKENEQQQFSGGNAADVSADGFFCVFLCPDVPLQDPSALSSRTGSVRMEKRQNWGPWNPEGAAGRR